MKEKLSIEERKEIMAESNPDMLFADGLDDALIGVAERACKETVAVYDRQKCIRVLMKQKMTEEEAVEYFEFNTVGAWMGENTPIFITKI